MLILVFVIETIFAQKTFTHFPLEKGNRWYFAWAPQNDASVLTVLEVYGDTTMQNGKSFARIDRMDRTDSGWTRSKGYLFLREENKILYKYPNDTLINYSWNDSTKWNVLPKGFTKLVVDTSTVFNKTRLTYFFYIYYPYEGVSYSDSIGFNSLHYLGFRDWTRSSRHLVGCIINKINYGLVTAINNKEKQIPDNFRLHQNYPNPFNPATTIEYSIPSKSFVVIKVFDLTGKEIVKLINEEKYPGNYKIEFDAGKLTSGVYFYSLKAGNTFITKKMLLLK